MLEPDNRFYIADINSKVEEVEFIDKNEVIGQCIDDTPLGKRVKLLELLNHLLITKRAHKLAASPLGDDSEGFYVGFILTSGNIVITWEPGQQQKSSDDIKKQSTLFRTFSEMLPVIIYEVDLKGNITYGNELGLSLFGLTREDISRGLNVSDLFPDSFHSMLSNLEAIKARGRSRKQ